MKAIFCLLFLSFALCAQTQQGAANQQEENAVFKAGVSLVRVDALVVANGRPVDGLAKEDFTILDNGAPQTIEYFGHESEPLFVVLALDVSGSMSRRLSEVGAVARQALGQLTPKDRVAVLLFGRKSRIAQEFTADPQQAVPAIQDAAHERSLGAGTNINQAVIDAAAYIRDKAANAPGRRAILMLTDNQGLAYQLTDETVLEALSSANAVFNSIVTPNARPPAPPRPADNPDFTPHDVFKLAKESGGEVLKSAKAGESFQDMLERLRTRYSLHYRAPENAGSPIHSIRVELSQQGRRKANKAEVRARTAYTLGR